MNEKRDTKYDKKKFLNCYENKIEDLQTHFNFLMYFDRW